MDIFFLSHHLNWGNITNGKCMIILGLGQKDGFDIRDHKKNVKLRKLCPLALILYDSRKDYHCSMQQWSNWVQHVNTHVLQGAYSGNHLLSKQGK
jgi:hypothetical protein